VPEATKEQIIRYLKHHSHVMLTQISVEAGIEKFGEKEMKPY